MTMPTLRSLRAASTLAAPRLAPALLALGLGLMGALPTARAQATDTGSLLQSVLWLQQSLEYRAAAAGVYHAASDRLESARTLPGSAALEDQPAARGRRPAVVMDLDETALDNSAYSAWMVRQAKPYDEGSWQAWLAQQAALEVPGAAAFTQLAARKGVDVFYVSNRACVPDGADACPAKAHTLANLARLGFARAVPQALMLKGERPDWGSDKSTRREEIARTHRIIMLLGDDLRDFLPPAAVEQLRGGTAPAELQQRMKLFGSRWFMLPNPMYGSWENGLPADPALRRARLRIPDGFPTTPAAPLSLATWNLAWLADKALSPEDARRCEDEARQHRDFDARPTPACRKGAPFRQAADVARLREHARALAADVVAVQEVEGVEALRALFDADTFDMQVLDGGGWQKVGLVVRKSVLMPGTRVQWLPLRELGQPLPRDQRGALEARLTLRDGGTLDVLSLHLKSRCVEPALDSGGAHCPQLAAQAPILGRWVAQKQAQGRPFALMGDFNRNFDSAVERGCDGDSAACGAKTLRAWLDSGPMDQPPVIVPSAALKHGAGCFDTRYGPAAIEHIVLGGGAEKGYVAGSLRSLPYLDTRTRLPITDHAQTVREYSDHCVVSVEWQP